MPFTLSCISMNKLHTCFSLFDGKGANCGIITILTADTYEFIASSWAGSVRWNNKFPMEKEEGD